MKSLRETLEDYLQMRRSLGFKLAKEGVRLPKFLAFMQERKGRKERSTPLAKRTATVLRAWLREPRDNDIGFVFPNARGGRLRADGVQYILAKHVAQARTQCPTLAGKRVTCHVLRHTAAMELLQAGVDRAVIALWLGHESVETTQIYLDANLAIKEEALAKTNPITGRFSRYKPDDAPLAFLKAL